MFILFYTKLVTNLVKNIGFKEKWFTARHSTYLNPNKLRIVSNMDLKDNKTDDDLSYSMIKSSSDKLNYKYLVLSNGLKALLVSDPSFANITASNENLNEINCEELSENELTDGNDGTSSNECDTDEEREDSMDSFKGKSRLRAASDEKFAAVAVCVQCGSFDDPKQVPGLAHLMEHVVTMGSQKYPKENGLDDFLNSRGGYQNAHTEYEYTMFEIEVQRIHFYETLKRLANCFIAPLLKPDSIERELKPIDTEFREAVPDDDSRLEQIISNYANDGHPFKAFSWGNMLTLKTNPEKLGLDMHQFVKQFNEEHYVANKMFVVVQSQESLETLENWVRALFSPIRSSAVENKRSVSDLKLESPFLNNANFNRLYLVEPVNQTDQLIISWCLPPIITLYKTSPLDYLSTLIGHEGKGSLILHLRREGLALELSAGNDSSGFQNNAYSSMFVIGIKLTDFGRKSIDKVVEYVFEYLNMLRNKGPQEWFFNEIKQIEENKFNWQEEQSAVNYVKMLAHNLIYYPVNHVLCGDKLYFEYNKSIIEHYLYKLTVLNANFIMLSPSILKDSKEVLTEPWMGTQYAVLNVPQSWISLNNIVPSDRFHYPSNNPFIATDFSLKEKVDIASYPTKVIENNKLKVWFRQDDKFNHPKSIIKLHIISPYFRNSVESAVILDLMVDILCQNLSETIYDATLSGLYWSLTQTFSGLLVTVYGFNHKLDNLLYTIINKMINFEVEEKVFNDVKKSLSQTYHNNNIDPNTLNRSLRLSIVCEIFYSYLERRNVLKNISKDILLEHINKVFADFYIESLIQGNYNQEECIELMLNVEEKIKLNLVNIIQSQPQLRATQISEGNECFRVMTLGVNAKNSAITNYYQIGCANIEMQCLALLLSSIMEEPIFDTLRTKEGLGYLVTCTDYDTFGITGFGVIVNSSAEEFDCSFIDERIEIFLTKMIDILEEMKEHTFKDHVTAIIKLKKTPDLQLLEEVSRNWSEIESFNYCFNRLVKEINCLEKISFTQFKQWAKLNILSNGKNRRKISIQIVGNGTKALNECIRSDGLPFDSKENELITEKDEKNDVTYKLIYLRSKNENNFGYKFIDNICNYKQKLIIYPNHYVTD